VVEVLSSTCSWWVKQISSLSKQHVLNHNRLLDRAPTSCGSAGLPDTCLRNKLVERLEVTQVPCAFTQDLARQYAPELLISDVEGIDDQIVGSWLVMQKPKYIIAEIKNLVRVDEFLDDLRDLGYCVFWGLFLLALCFFLFFLLTDCLDFIRMQSRRRVVRRENRERSFRNGSIPFRSSTPARP